MENFKDKETEIINKDSSANLIHKFIRNHILLNKDKSKKECNDDIINKNIENNNNINNPAKKEKVSNDNNDNNNNNDKTLNKKSFNPFGLSNKKETSLSNTNNSEKTQKTPIKENKSIKKENILSKKLNTPDNKDQDLKINKNLDFTNELNSSKKLSENNSKIFKDNSKDIVLNKDEFNFQNKVNTTIENINDNNFVHKLEKQITPENNSNKKEIDIMPKDTDIDNTNLSKDEANSLTESKIISSTNNNISNNNLQDVPINKDSTFSYNNIICKIHKETYIDIDTHFNIICTKCSYKISDLQSTSKNAIQCNNDDKEAVFFCSDCNCFSCRQCFSKIHKLHNSDLIENVANSLKKNENKWTHSLIINKEELNKGIILLEEIINKIKIIKNSCNINNNSYGKNIIKMLEDKYNVLESNFISNLSLYITGSNKLKFVNKSNNKEDDNYNIEHFKKAKYDSDKIKNLEDSIKSIIENQSLFYSNNDNSKKDVYTNLINQQASINLIKNIINEKKTISNALLSINSNKDFKNKNNKTELILKNKKKYNNKVLSLKRDVCNYIEFLSETVVNSEQSNCFNNTYYIRRFIDFNLNPDISYFKSTGISIRTDLDVTIKGITICGMYVSNLEKIKLTTNEIKPEEISIPIEIIVKQITVNENADRKSLSINNSNKSYYTESNKESKKNDSTINYNENILLKQSALLKPIISDFDPVFSIKFNKEIKCIGCIDKQTIKTDNSIVILVKNLSSKDYVKLYTGKAAIKTNYNRDSIRNSNNNDNQNIQILCDNETNMNINNDYIDNVNARLNFFYISNKGEFESDFSEMTKGIISDIIYSRD